ncbi:AMP-binding protein [Amycolatopsis sp. WGS_07]|uniref:AMP-binding protein n=1 Tax=Amycolatopsis sp. WGS_07 TaxID=3076764 RepID=UPI003872DD62
MTGSVGALVERCARRYGQEVAVECGGRKITHHEQIGRIRRTGRALLALGLRPGDRVALLMGNSPELVDVWFGLAWAGLAVVPLDPVGGPPDHAFRIGDSGARAVVHDPVHAGAVTAEHTLDTERLSRLAAAQPDGPGMPDVASTDLFGIYYTGDENGHPIGAVHTHGTYLAAVLGHLADSGLGERDRFAHVAPITHASGMFVLPTWLRGGTNVLLDRFDPDLFARTAEPVTATMLVPTTLHRLVEHGRPAALSTVVCGVAPARASLLLAARELFGPVVTCLYGLAEAPNLITTLAKTDRASDALGRPVTIAETRLAGDGELLVRGPHVSPGYWRRPDRDPGGWLHTGDLVEEDDQGFLHPVGRKKDLIVSGGYPVFAAPVEEALAAHPAVRQAAVIGIPDDLWGERVAAVVVADPGSAVSGADLTAWTAERLGRVRAPKTVEFVASIPRLASGQPDKAALRGNARCGT